MDWLKSAAILILAFSLTAGCRPPRPEIAPPARAEGAAEPEPAARPPLAAVAKEPSAGPPGTAAARELTPPPTSLFVPKTLAAESPNGRRIEFPAGAAGDLARYGLAIIEGSSPAELPQNRPAAFPSGGLSCSNCHLDGGWRTGAFSWRGTVGNYPRYEPRFGRMISLEDQVNSCIERCLNAPPLATESREMRGILAYLHLLARSPAGEAPPPLIIPARLADLPAGEEVFRASCRRCHGDDGAGGTAAPPLWGPRSYGTGAPMHRLLTAAAFIRAQMPPGEAVNSEQAFDVAAYVNSFNRPETRDVHLDYPALTEKPVDCPYPPFADGHPATRHKYGPFGDQAASVTERPE